MSLAFFYSDGLLGAAFFGPQARIMDGVLGRANCLLIATLWSGFKFVMVPIGAQLATIFSPAQFAVVFALIWGSYLVADTLAEVGGSLFGKQTIRVRGIGDVNRKSIGGTVSGLVGGLVFCLWVVLANDLDGRVDRAGRHHRGVEHAARAVLASRHRRLRDGDGQRADLLGVRRAAVVSDRFPGYWHSVRFSDEQR